MTELLHSHEIPELDKSGLRRFGLSTGAIVGGLFGFALPFLFNWNYPRWPWIIAAILIVWALLFPSSLNRVYHVWMRFGLLLNRIVSPIVLGVVFFLVVTPTGLIMRLTGNNPMNKTGDAKDGSLRVRCEVRDAKHLERPY